MTTKVKKYCYEKGDYDKLKRVLADVNWKELFLNGDVDQVWSAMEEKILEAVEACIPSRVMTDGDGAKRRKPRWMNTNVMAQIRKKESI